MTNELIVDESGSPYAVMPVLDLQAAAARRQAVIDFTKKMMVKGTDFGVVPGTGTKPTLLKPGAEKLASLFGLSPLFEVAERVMDWTGEGHGDEPFFYVQYRCTLTRGEMVVGQGLGSCNSWEKKYRYRNAERVCPACGKAAIIKGKQEYGGGWLCFKKKDGCGYKYADDDPRIVGQEVGQVRNPDPADVVNTIDKMAQKRALVAAVLIAVNASELFTQDVEDYSDIVEGEWVEPAHAPQAPAKATPPPPPPAKPARSAAPPPPPPAKPARSAAPPPPPDEPPPGELPDYRALAVTAKAANEFDYAAYMTLRNGVYDSVERVTKARANLVPDWSPSPASNEAVLLALEVYRDKRAAAEGRGEAAAAAHSFARQEALVAYGAAMAQ